MHDRAVADGKLESQLTDLAAVGLPLYDEAKRPSLPQCEHDHARRWSAVVEAANAVVFVTPEYNHAPPPALVNAIHQLRQGMELQTGCAGQLRWLREPRRSCQEAFD
jgi:NAD(P)H-dependent FMN reductase